MDMKSLMKALRRGGAAGKTVKFCCCCNTPNTIRGNLLVHLDGQVFEINHGNINTAREIWNAYQDINMFHCFQFPVVEDHQDGALSGVTTENISVCTLHADQRSTNNSSHYRFQEV